MAWKFEVFPTKNGETGFRLKSPNGKKVMTAGESIKEARKAVHTIERIKEHVANAKIVFVDK